MLSELLDIIYPFSNGSLVTSCSHFKDIIKNLNVNYAVEEVNDARSATFFAFGKSNNTFAPTVVVVDEKDATSTYTGLTEAMYQNIPVFMVVISKHENDEFWSFCTGKHFVVRNEREILEIKNTLPIIFDEIKFSPILFEVIMEYQTDLLHLSGEIVTSIGEYLSNQDNIIVSNIALDGYEDTDKYKVIEDCNETYGVISKYVGYCYNSVVTNILICSSKDVYLDINIFNCRYISPTLKIFVYENCDYSINIRDWVEANGFKYMTVNCIDNSTVDEVMNCNMPILVYIKRG